MQQGVPPGDAGSNRQTHGNPVVGFTVNLCAVQFGAATDSHAVCEFLDAAAHLTELPCHDREAVCFLDPQLLSVTNTADALGAAGGYRQYWDFIHEPGDQFATDIKGLQRAVANPQVSHRLSGHISAVEHAYLGAHLLQYLEDAGSAGVEPHVLHCDLSAWGDGTGHQPEGGGADVTWHYHRLTFERLPRNQGHNRVARTAHRQLGAEGPQHSLAVIAALGRLDHGGGPVSGEGGKQDGALHLG